MPLLYRYRAVSYWSTIHRHLALSLPSCELLKYYTPTLLSQYCIFLPLKPIIYNNHIRTVSQNVFYRLLTKQIRDRFQRRLFWLRCEQSSALWALHLRTSVFLANYHSIKCPIPIYDHRMMHWAHLRFQYQGSRCHDTATSIIRRTNTNHCAMNTPCHSF